MRLGLFLPLVALLVSCRAVPLVVPLESLTPPGTADFALDPVPVPAESALLPLLARLGPVAVLGERTGEEAGAVLIDLFPERAEPERAPAIVRLGDLDGPPESFEVRIDVESERVRIDLLGADAAGRAWAAATLRQLVLVAGGRSWIRLGSIRDRPGFPLRGSKRPRAWERRYRANFAWRAGKVSGLERVATLAPGGVLDATETGVARAEAFFRDGLEAGVSRFALLFDDVTYHLTEESRDRFGSYPRAVVVYLAGCRERLARLDPEATLYWLPQTYWTRHPMFDRFARDVGMAGGLPKDIGLVLTGPDVISAEIPSEEIARARRAFGLTRTKALLYDNRGREGDHGPLRGRDPALAAEADAVFGERGEVLNRITRLDFAWNPEGYDPDRSLLLACREVFGAAAARDAARLALRGPDLPPLERDTLFLRARRRLDPPSGSPFDAGAILNAIRRDSASRADVDRVSQPP